MEHQEPAARPSQSWLTKINAPLARYSMYLGVIGLLAIVGIVVYQVFGRYVLNKPPTWAESLALVLVLYVTLFGAAAGVRDAGHIGMESLLVLLPEKVRHQIELLIHGLIIVFALCMVYNGLVLGEAQLGYKIPNLPFNEWVRYVPLVLSGIMIVMFSIEHIIAAINDEEVIPSWH